MYYVFIVILTIIFSICALIVWGLAFYHKIMYPYLRKRREEKIIHLMEDLRDDLPFSKHKREYDRILVIAYFFTALAFLSNVLGV